MTIYYIYYTILPVQFSHQMEGNDHSQLLNSTTWEALILQLPPPGKHPFTLPEFFLSEEAQNTLGSLWVTDVKRNYGAQTKDITSICFALTDALRQSQYNLVRKLLPSCI